MTIFVLTKKVGKYTFHIEEVEAPNAAAAIEAYCRPRGEARKWYQATPKVAA